MGIILFLVQVHKLYQYRLRTALSSMLVHQHTYPGHVIITDTELALAVCTVAINSSTTSKETTKYLISDPNKRLVLAISQSLTSNRILASGTQQANGPVWITIAARVSLFISYPPGGHVMGAEEQACLLHAVDIVIVGLDRDGGGLGEPPHQHGRVGDIGDVDLVPGRATDARRDQGFEGAVAGALDRGLRQLVVIDDGDLYKYSTEMSE